MFTSDIEHGKRCVKTALVYLGAAVFCALFGGVYERFSHEVYSYFMIYAFVFPLVGGTAVFLLLCFCCRYPKAPARMLYHAGIATLTVGSVVEGILEIYGTSSFLTMLYWLVGLCLTAEGILFFLFEKRQK